MSFEMSVRHVTVSLVRGCWWVGRLAFGGFRSRSYVAPGRKYEYRQRFEKFDRIKLTLPPWQSSVTRDIILE